MKFPNIILWLVKLIRVFLQALHENIMRMLIAPMNSKTRIIYERNKQEELDKWLAWAQNLGSGPSHPIHLDLISPLLCRKAWLHTPVKTSNMCLFTTYSSPVVLGRWHEE
jgi:hypothetical protein